MSPDPAAGPAGRPHPSRSGHRRHRRHRRHGWRSTLAVRLTLLVVAVAVAVAGLAGIVGTALVRDAAADATRGYLSDQADVIAGQLAGEQPGYRIGLSKLAQVLAQQGVSVVTVDRRGVLAGDDPAAVRTAAAAGAAGLAGGRNLSATADEGGHAVLLEGRSLPHRGFVLVASPDLGAATQQALQRRVLLALAIGLAVAVAGGLVLAALVARPLRRTALAARALGAGARDVRVPAGGPREAAEVAAAVNELADALARSEARQRAFLASVSHELRTPLTAVQGQGQALADGLVPADEVPDVGRTVVAESVRLGRMVGDLLDLARLGADAFPLDPAPSDLAALARGTAAAWWPRCRERGVDLRVEVPDRPVVVVTDPRRLRQVLDGLADNALRLLEPGRPLVFGVQPVPATGSVRLQVRDGGPGLAPDDYPVAFLPGVLHERYRAHRPSGAGLGLALADSLVRRLGGAIAAGPAPEGGLAVTIELPA
ncbi:sensor histidine kinase [Nakamurella endophytica]|uniref:histidine kinase n=1 Tax=Nakamurella endophytica TaxID=1748367 RepID=A0A917SYH2_9ACTN|nr:HAMP domain-containing sensor histidine kinase [Nakamurella endophytica]GGM03882.1 two-component sensor histidine kinase [Nakamurella endophytica]